MKASISPKLRSDRATTLRARGRDSILAIKSDTCVLQLK
jgi:hypothetical protein